MQHLNTKLRALRTEWDTGERPRIAILGLGSVGNYLLNYLQDSEIESDIIIGCRRMEKAKEDVHISRVAAVIRHGTSQNIRLRCVDLADTSSIAAFLRTDEPHIIVNSSRVYSGIKYGSISWNSIRAYGLWAPLAVPFIRNIMAAHAAVKSEAIVINTSYSDVVIPWLRSAGMPYPDFGSGNLNHLVPRIKLAAAGLLGVPDTRKIGVILAASHFHDVVISKEGQTEGVDPLLKLTYGGKPLDIDPARIWPLCALSMPADSRRNMMNASSNFEIISALCDALKKHKKRIIHSPGVAGCLGGYPVVIDGTAIPQARIDETFFSISEMQEINRRSLASDGIENVQDGCLTFTPELARKAKQAFGTEIPRCVHIREADNTADWLIRNIIRKNVS